MNSTANPAIVIEFDAGVAQEILARVHQLTLEISVAMGEVNQWARAAGKPPIQWRRVDLRDV